MCAAKEMTREGKILKMITTCLWRKMVIQVASEGPFFTSMIIYRSVCSMVTKTHTEHALAFRPHILFQLPIKETSSCSRSGSTFFFSCFCLVVTRRQHATYDLCPLSTPGLPESCLLSLTLSLSLSAFAVCADACLVQSRLFYII